MGLETQQRQATTIVSFRFVMPTTCRPLFHWRYFSSISSGNGPVDMVHGAPGSAVGGRWTVDVPSPIPPRADTGEEECLVPCAIGARRTWRSAPTLLAYTSPESTSQTHTFASTNRSCEIFRPNLADSATTSLPFRVVVVDGLHVSSSACPSNFSPHPFRSRQIDRSRNHGHGHDVHRLPVPAPCSCHLRGRSARRRMLIGRSGRREPRPRPRHLRLRDSGHGPRRDHRRADRAGHGDGRAARHGRRRHHGRAGVHGGRRVVPRLVALRRAGHLERRLRARCDLELADRPSRAREGGPRRAQRRREPGARAGHRVWPHPLAHHYHNSQFTPVTLSMALRWFLQMSAAEATVLHGDHADIFGMGGTNGMARVAIDALPVVRFTERSSVDASGDLIACSVCLQEFQAGDSARSLPVCRHTFHLPCIDGWLLRHASCPLCRRSV